MTKTWNLIVAPRDVVVIVFYFDYALGSEIADSWYPGVTGNI